MRWAQEKINFVDWNILSLIEPTSRINPCHFCCIFIKAFDWIISCLAVFIHNRNFVKTTYEIVCVFHRLWRDKLICRLSKSCLFLWWEAWSIFNHLVWSENGLSSLFEVEIFWLYIWARSCCDGCQPRWWLRILPTNDRGLSLVFEREEISVRILLEQVIIAFEQTSSANLVAHEGHLSCSTWCLFGCHLAKNLSSFAKKGNLFIISHYAHRI